MINRNISKHLSVHVCVCVCVCVRACVNVHARACACMWVDVCNKSWGLKQIWQTCTNSIYHLSINSLRASYVTLCHIMCDMLYVASKTSIIHSGTLSVALPVNKIAQTRHNWLKGVGRPLLQSQLLWRNSASVSSIENSEINKQRTVAPLNNEPGPQPKKITLAQNAWMQI